MKPKTIKQVISKKFLAWRDSLPESLRALAEESTICTGGAIASMLMREEVNDFDFYFRTYDAALKFTEHYVAIFKDNPPPKFKDGRGITIELEADREAGRIKIKVKSAGVASADDPGEYEYFEGDSSGQSGAEYVAKVMDRESPPKVDTPDKFKPALMTGNAITLSGDIQLIIRFFGEPDKIHENYDFVHATNYWTSWDNHLELRREALESILAKDLRYVGSKYPLCSLIRMRKFVARGWTITAGQILKIAFNLQGYNLRDIAVLEEQLTGVDVAYFAQLLAIIQKDKDNGSFNEKGEIESNYLMQLVDRIF